MKIRIVVPQILVAGAVALAMSSVNAAPFIGSPSPSLSPVFLGGTLIDFDDKPTGTVVGFGDYAGLGVAIFESEGVGTFARYSGSQSSPNYIGTGFGGDRGDNASGWDGTISFIFGAAQARVGLGVADSAFGPETFSIYDSSHTLLETLTVPTGANTYAGFDRLFADIRYLEVKGDFFAVDDLQFSTTPIPEPETYAMLLAGLGLLGFMARRRKESAV
ncbi:MAG: FxDxF family PEP-CTERM protein [Nitrosomonas sp.]|nr:FxDxF family PEP-CTERM protein [Nitrosomonas sp.]